MPVVVVSVVKCVATRTPGGKKRKDAGRRVNHGHRHPHEQQHERQRAAACAVAVSIALTTTTAIPGNAALASPGSKPPPLISTPEGCTVKALDLFADVRAKFSLEVSTGALPEAVLTLGGCDYSGKNLHGKILSGVNADGSNFEGADLSATEMSRTSARNSNLRGVNFASANAYEARFDGSDLRGANFDGALLSNATFGKGEDGKWANVDGVNFDGALVSSSDARKLCQNPTLDVEGEIAIGGC